LNDYVPFYFTPFSPMLLNIKSGRAGITQRSNDEIVILVSSLHRVAADANLRWLFTDSHAYYQWANYYSDLQHLDQIDWPILQARDFKRDPDDPAKFERYQAEALVYQHMPVSTLLGVVCYTPALKQNIESTSGGARAEARGARPTRLVLLMPRTMHHDHIHRRQSARGPRRGAGQHREHRGGDGQGHRADVQGAL
jgi:hypothetical protein